MVKRILAARKKRKFLSKGIGSGFIKNVITDYAENYTDFSRVDSGPTHVSALFDPCARKHVISSLYLTPTRNDKVDAGMQLVWAYGRALESFVRDVMIKSQDKYGYKVYGRWVCPCGDSFRDGFMPDHKTIRCSNCDKPLLGFEELSLLDKKAGIIGNPDLMLFHNDAIQIIEIKSIKELDSVYEKPIIDHELQVSMYWYLAKLNKVKVHDKVIILYGQKKYKYGTPFVEHQVHPYKHKNVLVGMREDAKLIKQSIENNYIPARPSICQTNSAPMAKKCALRDICSSIDSNGGSYVINETEEDS